MTQFTTNLRLVLPNFNITGWHDEVNQNFRTLDVVIAASTGITGVVGAWDNGIDYEVGNKVVDSNNDTAYRCLVSHTSAVSGTFEEDRTANPTYWVIVEIGVSVRGAWLTATTYYVGDIVYDLDENIVAMCEVEHVSDVLRTDGLAGKWVYIADLKNAVDLAQQAAEDAIEAAENASEIADGDIGPIIAASTFKAALVDNDRFAITNSELSHDLQHTTYGNLKSLFETINDAAYAPIVHTHAQSDVTGLVAELALKATIDNAVFTGTTTLAGDPAGALQAATKQYVDNALLSLGKRLTVRAATTANITISTALNNSDTLDGITLGNGDYVLVKNQTSQTENGIYVVGAVPARATEFDTWNEITGGLVIVMEGSTNADSMWLNTNNAGGTLGVTNITYTQLTITGELKAANNLSDVGSPATAFANIKQSASLTATGVVELATDAEALAKADTVRVLTPSNLAALGSTETFAGFVELATVAEATAGVDTARAITAAGLAAGLATISGFNFAPVLISSQVLSGSTVSWTSLAPYKAFLLILDTAEHNSGGGANVRVALSQNNGGAYGTARQITNTFAGTAGTDATGWALILGTRSTNTKAIVPATHVDLAQPYFIPSFETSITGTIDAIRISPSGGSFDNGNAILYGIN